MNKFCQGSIWRQTQELFNLPGCTVLVRQILHDRQPAYFCIVFEFFIVALVCVFCGSLGMRKHRSYILSYLLLLCRAENHRATGYLARYHTVLSRAAACYPLAENYFGRSHEFIHCDAVVNCEKFPQYHEPICHLAAMNRSAKIRMSSLYSQWRSVLCWSVLGTTVCLHGASCKPRCCAS